MSEYEVLDTYRFSDWKSATVIDSVDHELAAEDYAERECEAGEMESSYYLAVRLKGETESVTVVVDVSWHATIAARRTN